MKIKIDKESKLFKELLDLIEGFYANGYVCGSACDEDVECVLETINEHINNTMRLLED